MPHDPDPLSPFRKHTSFESETATPPEGPPAGTPELRPPRGFEAEKYPLRHKLLYSFGLSALTATMNTGFATLIRSTKDTNVEPNAIFVNPHGDRYMTETGAVVAQMSIIDRMRLSIKFNMTQLCQPKAETATDTFVGDGVTHLKAMWRPIFFSFPEKLDAADDDTTTTVAAILGLTKDSTFEDVVPLTTNKLPVVGDSELSQPVSTVNMTDEAFADYNMSTNLTMEDQVWDETLFQEALRRYTNKGALKACVGRTRIFHLTTQRPYKTFFIDKFVPRAVRRIVPYTFMGIQVHLPISQDIGQDYHSINLTGSLAHLGVKIIAQYHEWNVEHDQTREDA